jgi:hypothetical protein
LTAAIVQAPAEVTRLLFHDRLPPPRRIGDHAKNVAEEVVYLCEAGKDIRHSPKPADAADA